jgi:hypothetical protein
MAWKQRISSRGWRLALGVLLCGPAALAACGSSDSGALAGSPDGGKSDAACAMCGDSGLPIPNVDASVCHAADLSSWPAPEYHPASGTWQGLCDETEIHAFYDACLGANATHDACVAETTNNSCSTCLVSRDDAPKYGPLVAHGAIASINYAGCLELLDVKNGIACARYVQAASACEIAACAANCPVKDDASLKAYDQCAGDADKQACASFAASAQCAFRETDGGGAAIAVCDPAQSFEQAFFALAALFCGSRSLDAGTD